MNRDNDVSPPSSAAPGSTSAPEAGAAVPPPPATETVPPPPAPETAASTALQAELDKLKAELDTAKAQAAQAMDNYRRALADFDNIRRRAAREREEGRRQGAGNLLEDLLPVFDDLERGLELAKTATDLGAITNGFGMVVQQFRQVLGRQGLVIVEPKEGEGYVAAEMEALTQQPHATVAEGQVLLTVRKGYRWADRLLRPASVIVSAGPAPSTGPT